MGMSLHSRQLKKARERPLPIGNRGFCQPVARPEEMPLAYTALFKLLRDEFACDDDNELLSEDREIRFFVVVHAAGGGQVKHALSDEYTLTFGQAAPNRLSMSWHKS